MAELIEERLKESISSEWAHALAEREYLCLVKSAKRASDPQDQVSKLQRAIEVASNTPSQSIGGRKLLLASIKRSRRAAVLRPLKKISDNFSAQLRPLLAKPTRCGETVQRPPRRPSGNLSAPPRRVVKMPTSFGKRPANESAGSIGVFWISILLGAIHSSITMCFAAQSIKPQSRGPMR